MKTNELRTRFLNFFKSKDHKIVSSASLVPEDDPTLLFTSAGMAQFKENFLGIKRDLKRAASCQKCLRTGDLENVGRTPAHQTFFEMLGNFSFGDYFKEEAIAWAWEFLTRELNVPEKNLRVSVYKDDLEAFTIWQKKIGLPVSKISRLGEKSNFWPGNAPDEGPDGPCGPCSEIFYDWGEKFGCGKAACGVACDCGRFIEVWNLVFTQYDRQGKGNLKPLPRKNIDTGMGLERLASVTQGARSNFETDLFVPIIAEIERQLGPKAKNNPSIRTIADHIRATIFLIGDGVLPSNEGRGYVERMLIRRASRLARQAGSEDLFLRRLVPTVIAVMREPYPDLGSREPLMKEVIQSEEERFARTLDEGTRILDQETARLKLQKETIFPGNVAFRLFDTFGFPIELTVEYLHEKGFKVDMNEFNDRLEEQRRISRSGSQMGGTVFAETFAQKIRTLGLNSKFLGYETHQAKGKILAIVENAVILDQSPFYGEAGGQVGDTGYLRKEGVEYRVYDAQKVDEAIVHWVTPLKGELKKGDEVSGTIDSARRDSIMRNHTATHLLQSALRQVLGKGVEQSGSLVAEDRLRFDFTHVGKVPQEALEKAEKIVNDEILKNIPLEVHQLPQEEAKRRGAICFFGEKYGDVVRVVEVPGFSQEFCGGTHCRATGDIGFLQIVSEGAVASGVRRIEAVTGEKAYQRAKENEMTLRGLAALLKTSPDNVTESLRRLLQKVKQVERLQQSWNKEAVGDFVEAWIQGAETVGPVQLVARAIAEADPGTLRSLWDRIKVKLKRGIAVFWTIKEGKLSLVIGVTHDLVKEGWDASQLIQPAADWVGGSGGGKKDLAQAGGKKPERVEKAIAALKEEIIRFKKT